MHRVVLLCLASFSLIFGVSMFAAGRGPSLAAVVHGGNAPSAAAIIHQAHASGDIALVELGASTAQTQVCMHFWDASDRDALQAQLLAAGVPVVEGDCNGELSNPEFWPVRDPAAALSLLAPARHAGG